MQDNSLTDKQKILQAIMVHLWKPKIGSETKMLPELEV
jgi:hypothetical protein